MKKLQYLLALVLLTVSLPTVAQSKVYIRLPQESVILYPTQTTYSWREKIWPVADGALYEDTVKVTDIAIPDTIYSLKMTLKKYLAVTHYGKTCQTELPYLWRNKPFYNGGVYYDTIKTTLPQDTVYTLQLTVGTPSEHIFSYKICHGEKVEFQGRTYTEEGIDTIRLTSYAGCDSLLIVNVRVGHKTQTTLEQQICEGSAYTWTIPSTGKDTVLTQTGYYYDSLVSTTTGCDSLLCLHLVVNKPRFYKDSISVCEHDLPYVWHHQTLNATGIYCDTVHQANQCDSITQLSFTVLPDQHEQTTITFCGDYGTRHNGGDLFFNDTVFIDTLRTADNGCFRIVKTTYLAGHTYRYEEYQHRPENHGPYIWRGQVYVNDGTHVQTHPGTIGCDSTWILHLMTDYIVHLNYTFCEGTGISYKGKYITKPCCITDSLTTVYGGDSVIIANFTQNNRYQFVQYDTICSNTPYIWEGHDVEITGPGTYIDRQRTVDGCDSIYTLYLAGGIPWIKDTLVNISQYHQADSLPFIWHGNDTIYRLYSDTDIVEYRGSTTEGCDSIYTLHFHVAPKWSLDTAYLCHGEVVRDGHRFTAVGDYEIWLFSPHATNYKDSVLYLHVDSAKIYDSNYVDSIVICKNETPYYWHSRILGSSGEYSDVLPAHQRGYCDSIVHLNLTVNPDYQTTITHSVCEGSTFDYNGHPLTPGIHYDTLHSLVTGCDSVLKIIVNQVPNYHFEELAYFFAGTQYVWTGHMSDIILTKPGIYWDSCATVEYGCDSIYRLDLREKRTYLFLTDTTICSCQKPFRWRNKWIYDAGVFYDSLKTYLGADSVYQLNLRINDTKFTSFTNNYCIGDTVLHGDRKIFSSCIYYDSLTTQAGCDSIIQWIVNFQPKFFKTEVEHMRGAPVYHWHGMELNSPGIYYDSHLSVGGCDSTYQLTLIQDMDYAKYDTTAACGQYVWHGDTLYKSGDYQRRGKTIYDMDSVEHLNLTIYPIKRDTTIVKKCHGEIYYKNDRIITDNCIFNDTLSTTHGCDSITTTIAQFFPTYLFPTETIYLISGSSVSWHDTTITSPGIYTKQYQTTACGCDSIYTIQVLLADTFSYTEYATVCQKEMPYHWHDQILNEAGYYTKRYYTQHGADSIYHIYLTVAQDYNTTWNMSICPGESIQFFHKTITQPGTYRDTLLTVNGCDSIFILNVNQYFPQIYHDTTRFCEGQKVSILGQEYSKSGEYTYTTTTGTCDSIIHHIIISPRYFYEDSVNINEGSVYVWRNHKHDIQYTKAGIYYDSLHSVVTGCDSIYKLYLTVNPNYYFEENVTICKNEAPYIWHKQGQPWYLDSTNIYYDSLHTIYGCDSVYCLKLTVNPAIVIDTIYNACEGDEIWLFGKKYTSSTILYDTIYSLTCPQVTRTAINFYRSYYLKQSYILSEGERYQFFDITITTPGKYVHTGTTVHGCDSIVELTVTACQQQSIKLVNVTLCSGDSLQLGDTIVTKGCQFIRAYVSRYGCDSVVQYNVQEHPTYHFIKRDNFCENSVYTWRIGTNKDTIITREGRYDIFYKTVHGCDSIYTLFLTALPTYLHDTTIYRCPDEIPYIYRGKEYFNNQDFVDTFHTEARCDSIRITHFRINQHCSSMDLYTRCRGDMMIIDEQEIINDGEYRIPRENDSIHRFKVFSYPTYEFNTNLGTHCDSVTYHGTTYYAHGKSDTIQMPLRWKTIYGCDSTEHLSMVLYQSAPTIEHTQIIYDYASVLFGGQLYYETGDYERNYHTIHGCDSTYILHLKVIPTDSTGALHYEYCSQSKENIEVFGKWYHPSKDTIIFDTTAIPNVNMWIIKKAIVRVSYPFTITSLRTESEVCAQPTLPLNIVFTQNGSYPERYILDFLPNQLAITPSHHEGDINGRGTIELLVSGNDACVNPGDYAYRIKLLAGGCHMSDTTIYSTLIVRYPSSIIEPYWNNTVALVNSEFNTGKWVFQPPYNWQITDATGTDKTGLINPNQNLSYLSSDLLIAGDRVYVSPMRVGYDKAVPSCEYIFQPSPYTDKVPVLIMPTAVARRGMVKIQSSVKGTYYLYNSTGNICLHGDVVDGSSALQVPGVSGFYILKVSLQDGSSKTERLIVY